MNPLSIIHQIFSYVLLVASDGKAIPSFR